MAVAATACGMRQAGSGQPTYPIGTGTGAFARRQYTAYHISGQGDILERLICRRGGGGRNWIRSGAGIAEHDVVVAAATDVADVAAVVVVVNLTVNGR